MAPGRSSSTTPDDPSALCPISYANQSRGVKKSPAAPLNAPPGPTRRTASDVPSTHLGDAPSVALAPVATNTLAPSDAAPLGPQTPAPTDAVCHPLAACCAPISTVTTQPCGAPHPPSTAPNGT